MACSYETGLVRKLSGLTDSIAARAEALENAVMAVSEETDIGAEAEIIRDSVLVKMNELRVVCDEAETITAKSYWPFPTYGDLLFGVR